MHSLIVLLFGLVCRLSFIVFAGVCICSFGSGDCLLAVLVHLW